MIEPTNPKNWLTFGGDPVPRIRFRFVTSLTIVEKGILWHLLAFLIQSMTDFHETERNVDNESTTFWKQSGRHPDPNQD